MVELSNSHWVIESFTQRMTTKDWKRILLEEKDSIIFKGHIRNLKARNMGSGVVEVMKETFKP